MLRRAGMYLLAVLLGTGTGAATLTGPAAAGGWAVTVIDPAGPIEPGKAHQVSFWVLQHGTHPYNWAEPASMGTVGLMLSDDRGSRISFTGTPLPEPAHYVTTVTVPHAGRWKVTGIQGIFGGFHVGELTVPGTWQPLGVPAAPSPQDLEKYWPGKVRPPVLTIDRQRDPYVNEDTQPEVITEPAPANAAAGGQETGTRGVAATQPDPLDRALAGGLVILLLVALALGGRWWIRRGVPQT